MKAITAILCVAVLSCNPGEKKSDNPLAINADHTLILSPSIDESGEPFLFTDPYGKVYLSWIEKSDSNTHRLVFSMLEDSSWSTPATISSGENWFVNWADYPQFASDGLGHFIATWLQKSGKGTYAYDIMLSSSTGGKQWTAPFKLNEDGKEAEHGFVSIVPYPGKGFAVSWLDGRNTKPMPAGSHDHEGHDAGSMTLRAAILDLMGKKISESEVDNRTCDCCQTSLALSSDGPVVVYRDRSGDETRDIWTARMQNGKWQEPQPVSVDKWVINGCPVNGPRLDMSGSTAAVAWFTSANDSAAVYASFSTDGGKSFGGRIRIHDSIPLGRVDLIVADENSAVVTWMEGGKILLKKVRADGTSGKTRLIAVNNAARSAGFPQLTRKGEKMVIAWTDAANKRIQTIVTDIPAN